MGCNLYPHLLQPSMLDTASTLWVKMSFVDTIHLCEHQALNAAVIGVKIKATSDSKLNDSPVLHL